MTKCYLTLAALAAATASPALATAAPAPATNQPQPITRAAVQKARDEAFKKIDANGDGNVTAAELANAEATAARARLQAEFTRLDTNHDGQLSEAEFLAAAPSAAALTPDAAKALAPLDKNKDGKVTIDEFRAPQLAVFDRLDTNHDGTLSAAEREAASQRK